MSESTLFQTMARRLFAFRPLLAAITLVPAVLAQTVVPLVPVDWELRSEALYPWLAAWDEPPVGTADVVLLQVNDETRDAYGWPLSREYYIDLIDRLEASGRPWVLSMLHFSDHAKVQDGAEETQRLVELDAQLAERMRTYGRFIGTGIDFRPGSELTLDQEEAFLPRFLMTEEGFVNLDEELPLFPLEVTEADRFLEAQAYFGLPARFNPNHVVHCVPMYLSDTEDRFVLPSAMMFATGVMHNAGMQLAGGTSWAPQGASPAPMRIGKRHCFGAPSMATRDYLRGRQVELELGLKGFLEERAPRDWAGKLVILADTSMRKHLGPGGEVAAEPLLVARFMDHLVTGTSVRREPLDDDKTWFLAWLPVALAAVLLLLSLVVTLRLLSVALGVAFAGLVAVSMHQVLVLGVYFVPVQTFASLALTGLGVGMLAVYIKYYGMRRQVWFGDLLRDGLSQCNTVGEIANVVQIVCRREFAAAKIEFNGYDKDLHASINDPSRMMELLARGEADGAQLLQGHANLGRPVVRRTGGLLNTRHLQVSLPLHKGDAILALMHLDVTYRDWEEGFVHRLLSSLQHEVGLHWQRIELLVRQKLKDYTMVLERTRNGIFAKFLTQSLVSRFADGVTMEENLRSVLTPRPVRAALLQADIRGYTKVFNNYTPEETVQTLQGYFRNVVDLAQQVAQVKLIGDCIFLFIEERQPDELYSAADYALLIARTLVSETLQRNAERQQAGLLEVNFGIAVHVGDVIVGNLSSESCIDYTVVGPNVNKVARVEEVTKAPAVRELLGQNGVILTAAAHTALKAYAGTQTGSMNLDELGVRVRSYDDITTVRYLTAQETLALPDMRSTDAAPGAVSPLRLAS